MRSLPFVVCGAIILASAFAAAMIATRWSRGALARRVPARLLREVFARAVGLTVLLLGLYLTLRVANLTHLALTIVGGTGLLGLVLGIAFGNITENFLASVFLSMQHPFQVGDLVEIAGILGYIQRLTTRTTVVITLDGNEVQIPNATVYKSVIRNFTTIRNRREDFTVTVGRSDLDAAQQRAMDVLARHLAVLKDPEASVLVDMLTDTSVILRVYFWLDGKENSWLKVRSSVMRLVMHAVDQRANQPPLADGAPRSTKRGTSTTRHPHGRDTSPTATVITKAEGNFDTEAPQIEEQAQDARHDDAENLLKASPNENGKADFQK